MQAATVTKRTGKDIQISNLSALAPYVYKGVEGPCMACGQPIREHFGRKGVWMGCKAVHVPLASTFVLVPTVTSQDGMIVRTATLRRRATDIQPPTRTVRKVVDRPKVDHTYYVYSVADRRRVLPETFTRAIHVAYNALMAAKRPLSVEAAAKRAKRPRESNRRSLNILHAKGFVKKVAWSEAH